MKPLRIYINFATVSPVLCRYERMLMPIADRIGRVLYAKRSPLFIHKHYNAAYPVLSLVDDITTRTSSI